MRMLQSLFYLTTAVHVSVVTITHLQEHKTTLTTASGNLSAAIVEELELIWVCCGWRTRTRTALHVSVVTITHLQEHKTTVTAASGNRYTVLLSAAIVEELELIWVCCGWRTRTRTALHVSVVTITHLQEHKTPVTTASGNRYTVLLSAAIVEELELIWVCCGWRTLWRQAAVTVWQIQDGVDTVVCAPDDGWRYHPK